MKVRLAGTGKLINWESIPEKTRDGLRYRASTLDGSLQVAGPGAEDHDLLLTAYFHDGSNAGYEGVRMPQYDLLVRGHLA